ncbi:efflux RND transporter periplasmic adaptor subunit, partial [Azospirillum brasilense]|uniref:efflux RND transporter periplasmic adaptor subunit n=1 Tax=Azospirillum brasilense TaxID=192 RepID=UPI001FFFFE1D
AAAQVEATQAQIRQTDSTLQADEAQLGYTRIYAPMSGTLISVDARQGQTINSAYEAPVLMRIADLSAMTVWTQVSEADVTRLRDGMPLYFTTLGHPGRRWTARLHEILPAPPKPPASGKARPPPEAAAPPTASCSTPRCSKSPTTGGSCART